MSTGTATNKISNSEPCSDCGNPVPLDWKTCPHCARPQLFPNVRLANQATERAKLEQRYHAAIADAQTRGCSSQLAEFETVCKSSNAVFRCELLRLHAEIASGTDLYKPFHDIERLRLRYEKAANYDWPALRIQAERELLGKDEHLGHVHYASLSLNGESLSSYGNVTVQLSEKMIAHRASCVEGNSAQLFSTRGNLSDVLRSTWPDRGKLCVAKVGAAIHSAMKSEDFPGLIVKNSSTSSDGDFVEVIVFDSMTAFTFEAVRIEMDVVHESIRHLGYWDAVKEVLHSHNVDVVEV